MAACTVSWPCLPRWKATVPTGIGCSDSRAMLAGRFAAAGPVLPVLAPAGAARVKTDAAASAATAAPKRIRPRRDGPSGGHPRDSPAPDGRFLLTVNLTRRILSA